MSIVYKDWKDKLYESHLVDPEKSIYMANETIISGGRHELANISTKYPTDPTWMNDIVKYDWTYDTMAWFAINRETVIDQYYGNDRDRSFGIVCAKPIDSLKLFRLDVPSNLTYLKILLSADNNKTTKEIDALFTPFTLLGDKIIRKSNLARDTELMTIIFEITKNLEIDGTYAGKLPSDSKSSNFHHPEIVLKSSVALDPQKISLSFHNFRIPQQQVRDTGVGYKRWKPSMYDEMDTDNTHVTTSTQPGSPVATTIKQETESPVATTVKQEPESPMATKRFITHESKRQRLDGGTRRRYRHRNKGRTRRRSMCGRAKRTRSRTRAQ